jgi:subtilisin family serine protease
MNIPTNNMKKIAFFLCFFGITCITFWNLHVQPSETNVAKNQPSSNSDEPQPNQHPVQAVKNETEGAEAFIDEATVDPLDDFLETQSTSSPSLAENRSVVAESNHMQKIDEITLEVLESERVTQTEGELNSVQNKRISLRKTSFKYPYLIVEESLSVNAEGKESVSKVEALVANHLIINLQPHVDLEMAKEELKDLNCSLGDKITEGVYLVNIKGKPSIKNHFEKRESLNQIDHLAEIVEPDYFVSIVKMPNDSYRNKLWGMHNSGQTGGTNDKDIDGPEAWDKTTGSKNVLGAVIDTGIDRNHEDLKANMWTNPGEIAGNGKDDDGNGFIDDVHGWDFANNDNNPHDDHSHGTHCAGTIGGVGNNGKGVVGVAWNVSMVGIKFLSGSGGGATSDAIKSVAYATKIGVDFTSNSWGGGGSSASLKRAIEEAEKKGIGFIAAAGNHNGNNDSRPSYPASYDLDNVISVGAHDHKGNRASFSCYGKKSVDIFAPGVNTYSTVPGNRYASYSGTSMATPHVAGAYALVQSLNPDWTCKQIKEALMNSTDAETGLKERCVTGGRLNVFKALQTEPAKENLIVAKPATLDFGPVAKNSSKNMQIAISNPGSEETIVENVILPETSGFELSLKSPFKIPGGKQVVGTVTFTSTKEGRAKTELVIESDAQNTPRLVVPLSADVTATPDLVAEPESMHFDLNENETKTQALTLSNKGDGDLNYEVQFPNGQEWLRSTFQPTSQKLETAFMGGNGQKGNYLQVNVAAPNGISISSLTGYFANSGDVKVWIRPGMITEAIKTSEGWKEVATAKITTKGTEQRTFSTDFQLSEGSHTLLFVNSGSLKYTNESFGSIAAKDENLSILVGYGTARTSPAGSKSLHYGRKWNGAIHYSVDSRAHKGTLLSGKSVEIKTVANAKEMPTEYEEAQILISSNDPDEPQKKIKVTAQKLSEKAGLVFRPSSLSFENTYVGQTAEKSLILSNAGTKSLTVTQFVFRNSAFSHRLSLPFTLKAGEKRDATIYFTPKTAGKLPSSALVLTNEDGGKTRTFQVSGEGSLPPVMVVTPSSLSANLKSKQERTVNLRISNSGGSPLTWTLKGATTGEGKSLSAPFFAQSHFTPMEKGTTDNREGMPVSTLGGGPDLHGYNWTDSNDAAGPAHQWKDISKTGKRLSEASKSDDAFDKVALPFAMELYGKTFKEAFVSSNGYLSLGKGSSEHGHFPLPTTMMAGNLIAPFAMDLDPSRGGDVYVQETSNELLVQWNKVKDFAGIGEYTFQASLNRNGVIYFHYQKMDGKIERATTGIQNESADKALLVAYNNKQVKADSTIRISTSPKWLHVATTSGSIAGGKHLDIPVSFKSGSILAGTYKAILGINGNDPKRPAAEVVASLTIQATRTLAVNPSTVDFGQVSVGSSGEETVQMTNTGNAAISIGQINTNNGVYSASTPSKSLSPGESSRLLLRFSPVNGTNYTSTAQVYSNAVNSPVRISLRGKGIASPRFAFNPDNLAITVAAGQKTKSLASLLNKGKATGTFKLKEISDEANGQNGIGVDGPSAEQSDPFADEHVPNRLIVRYKDGQSGLSNPAVLSTQVKMVRELAKARKTGNGVRALNGLNLALVETVQSANLRDVAKALAEDPAVEYVEPDYIRRSSVLPNDPEWRNQYALQKIQAPQAWEKTKGSQSVIVAVIDTGIDYNHKDLQGNIWINPGEIANNRKDDDGNGYVDDVYGWDFCNNDNNPMDGNKHGTHVAGTIAAASNNNLQVAGVAWNTKLVALKFLSDRGWGSVSDAIDAVAYCTAMDFPISNNSWGGGGSSRAMKEAIDRAGQNGHLFCAAAGNSGSNNDSRPHYPSNYTSPNVLSVAASDSADRLASFSCYGKTSVDLAAPGVSILNLIPNNRVARLSGTSMATPHVAGAAALVLSMNKGAGYAELKRTLMESVDPIKSYEGKMVAPGRLNLLKALDGFSPGWLTVSPENGSVAAGNSATLTFNVDASNLTAGTKRAIVCFTTNDPLAKDLEFPVVLTVTGDPEITTDKKTLNFGELWVGNKKELQLTVSNPGTADLKVSSLTLGHKDLSVTPSTLSLKAGENGVLTILANPKTSGTISSHLTLVSNAKNSTELKVPVSLKSVLPPALLVSPNTISRTLEPNQKGTETLTFTNAGQANALWEASLVETERSRSRNRDLNTLIKILNKRTPEFNNPGLPVDQMTNASNEKESESAFRVLGGNANSALEVAILGANYADGNKDVALGLAETKRFAGITVIDVKSVTPTVKELQAFDSVLVHSNYSYRDNSKLGDNITAFAKDGGGVVTMVCENLTYKGSEKWTLGGQWKKEGHPVFSPSKNLLRTSSSMGEKTMPSHPLLNGVRTFAGNYRLSHAQTAKGAQIVTKWKDGQPLVTFKSSPFPLVDLNFYPVSKRKSSSGWDTATDGWKLIANALEWTTNGRVPSWIKSDSLAGTIKGNEKSQATISLDATDLSEGNYSAEFRVSSNDPAKPYQTVAIKLTVRKNAAPVAKPSLVNLLEDSSKAFKLLGSDPEGEAISYILVDQPKNGRIVGKAPDLTYVPNPNYNGTDGLSFKVSDGTRQSEVAKIEIKISPVNDAPWVKPGQVVSMEDEVILLGLQYGDVDGDSLQLEVTQKPENGFMIKDSGKWLYFPNPHYHGDDSVKFRVFDGKLRSKEATLVLNIKPSNDAPIASDIKVTAQEGKRTTFQLVAVDVDGDLMTYDLITAPKHGKIEATKNKSWAYTPFENYNGSDSLSFRVSDGKVRGNLAQVTFDVTPRNDAPVVASSTFALIEDGELKVKLIASDPEGDKLTFKINASTQNGSLTGNGPSYTYKPKTNFNGKDSFTVVANDGESNSQPAVITLAISSQNDAPKLTSIGTLSESYRETTFRMKLEAEDPDGDELTFALGQKPANGTCSIEGDQLVYMPNPGFTGIESLNIEVSDGKLSENSTLELPIREHPGSVGLFLETDGDTKSADLIRDLYAMNERLSKTADYLIKLDLEQEKGSLVAKVSEKEPDAECISLHQWKDQIKNLDPQAPFTFYPQMENGEISWYVGSFLKTPSGTDTEVDDKSSSPDKGNKDGQENPGKTPESPDPSSAPTEIPVLTILDLPTIMNNEKAPNWYSLNGLGNFFDAGNGWVYQPEMGWCFTEVCQEDLSLWVFSKELGWMWIKSDFPNMCFIEGEVVNGWSYFPKETITEAGLLYDYTNESWIKLK